jgi:uncharacterized protein
MKKTISIFSCLIFLVAIAPLQAQIVPYESEININNYEEYIEKWRSDEEESFGNKETTILSKGYFERFTNLDYFPIDTKYRVVGTLTKLSASKKTDLDLTRGGSIIKNVQGSYAFMRYGKINFMLEGKAVELEVYEFPSSKYPNAIFVPFTDETTGEENFGGGRFMIIYIPKDNQIVIDFNMAVNPICVYDPDHSCPVPPSANFIPQRILAGAKMYYDISEDKQH